MATRPRIQKPYFSRYLQIVLVVARHGLGKTIRSAGLGDLLPFRWVSWISLRTPWRRRTGTEPVRARMALEQLGTTFVKIGQILSTRTDLIPAEFAMELAKLQNSLKPLPVDVIEATIRTETGRPVQELFATFDPVPVGVASIGQAHAATLKDGTEVVVKIQKPGVAAQVEVDLEILRTLAERASQSHRGYQKYNVVAIVEELAETLQMEMDYVREGHGAEHFARFFKDDPTIHIPRIFWDLTTPRMLTMERMRGTNILELTAASEPGIDRKQLAIRCVNIWLTMLFEGNAFHADPHPGNLFLEKDGRLALIDFGMVGMVDAEMREHLASALQGILEGDVDLLVDSLIELGAVPTPFFGSRDRLRTDMKHFLNLYPNLTVADLTVGIKLEELFRITRRNEIQLPANTFILLKMIVMAESLGTRLDREFAMMPVLEPHIEKLLKKRYSPATLIERVPTAFAEAAVLALNLPRRISRLVRTVERGEISFGSHIRGLDNPLVQLERVANRLLLGFIAGCAIVALALLISVYRPGI